MQVAAQRRMLDELNIETTLEYVYKYSYEASFGGLGTETELSQVYLGKVGESVRANAHEIADIRYVSAAALAAEMDVSPERFTPWFKMEWQTLLTEHREILANYCGD
jgi:isopentenyl-diphosphate delta-isomerase